MNKKALLKEIRNHPKGSTMLSLGYSPSFIHGLLIEKMIKESPQEIAKLEAEIKKQQERNMIPGSPDEKARDDKVKELQQQVEKLKAAQNQNQGDDQKAKEQVVQAVKKVAAENPNDQQKDQAAQQIANSPAGKQAGVNKEQTANAIEKAAGKGGDKKEKVTAVTIFQTLITGSIINAVKPKVSQAAEKLLATFTGPIGYVVNLIGGTEAVVKLVMDKAISPLVQILLDFAISDENKAKADSFVNSIIGEEEALKLIQSIEKNPEKAKKIIMDYADLNKEQITTNVFTAAYKGEFGNAVKEKTVGLFNLKGKDVIPNKFEEDLPDFVLNYNIGETISDLLLGEKATDQITGKAPAEDDKGEDDDDDLKMIDALVQPLENDATGDNVVDNEIEKAADQNNSDEERTAAADNLGKADPQNPGLDQKDIDAIEKGNPDAIERVKQAAQQDDDPFADLKKKYDNSDFMKARTPEDKAVVYKFLQILQKGNLLNESIGNIVKALGLDDKGKKALTRAFAQLKDDNERKIIRDLLNDPNNSELFIKMIQAGKSSDDKTPKQQERIDNNKKQALGGYADAYKNFNKNFMKAIYLADQGKIFDGLYQIILTLSDKQTEDIDRDALAFGDANVEGADLSESLLNEQDKEGILKLYQQGLIPQTNKMQRNTDKIMDILEEYQKYASGDKIKQGSRELFQKYGEMDPKKLLFKVLQMTMKDIATLEEMLDEYKAVTPDSKEQEDTDIKDFEQDQEKEEGEQEVIPEALIKEEKDVKQIIEEVKAVYFAVINPDTPGRALYTRATKTTTGEKRTDSPGELQDAPEPLEESILREVYRLLKEEEEKEATNPDTQKNIKELALQVYEEMVKIRGYFPNVSPFGTDYSMDTAIKGLTKTLEGFNDLVLSINNKAKDKRVLGDVSELELKLNAIKENIKKYFGVSEYQKKAAKTGAMNDEGQKAVDQGKAEPTEDALGELDKQSKDFQADKSRQGKLEELTLNIITQAKSNDDIVKMIIQWFGQTKPGFWKKTKSAVSTLFNKAKTLFNEQEGEDTNELTQNELRLLNTYAIRFASLFQGLEQKSQNMDDIQFEKEVKKVLQALKSPAAKIRDIIYKDHKDKFLWFTEADTDQDPRNLRTSVQTFQLKNQRGIAKALRTLYNKIAGGTDFYREVILSYYLFNLYMVNASKNPDEREVSDDRETQGEGILALAEPERRNKIKEIFTTGRRNAGSPEKFTFQVLVDVIFDNFVKKEQLQENLTNDQYKSIKNTMSNITGDQPQDKFYDLILKDLVEIQKTATKKEEVSGILKKSNIAKFYQDPNNFNRFFKYYDQILDFEKEQGIDQDEEEIIEDLTVKQFREKYDERYIKVKKEIRKKQGTQKGSEAPDFIQPDNFDFELDNKSKEIEKAHDDIVGDIDNLKDDREKVEKEVVDKFVQLLEALEKELDIDDFDLPEPEGSEDDNVARRKNLDSYKEFLQLFGLKDDVSNERIIVTLRNNFVEKLKEKGKTALFGAGEKPLVSIENKETERSKLLIFKTKALTGGEKRKTIVYYDERTKEDKSDYALRKIFEKIKFVDIDSDDKPETQGLEKYTTNDTEKEMLNNFFEQLKGLNENFNLEIEKLDKNLANKVRRAIGKISIQYDSDQIKWLQNTLIKMIKEDRELFDQQAGMATTDTGEGDKEEIENEIKKEVEKDLEGEDTSKQPSEDQIKQDAEEVVAELEPDAKRNADELGLDEKDLIQMAIDEFRDAYYDEREIVPDDIENLLDSEFGKAIDDDLVQEFNKYDNYNEELHNSLRKRFRLVKEADIEFGDRESGYTAGDGFYWNVNRYQFSRLLGPLEDWINTHLKLSWKELVELVKDNLKPSIAAPDPEPQEIKEGLRNVFLGLKKYFEIFIEIRGMYKTENFEQTKEASEDLVNAAEKLDDINKEKPTETDDSAAKKDDTYSEALEKGFKPSNITRIICSSCSTKFNFAVPDNRLDKPRKKMKMRCLICAEQFPFSPQKGNYIFKKQGEKEILVKGRDIFEADGNLDALKEVKKEQLERKLEKIIEHYLNTGRI